MPFPLFAQAASLGVGLFSSISNIIGAGKEKKEAQKDLNEFDYNVLSNVFENMSLATKGSELIKEEAALASATAVDAARESGSRFVFGALPGIVKENVAANQASAADLDRQFAERERLVAGDNQRIQGVEEQRSREELAGIGQRLNVANQNKATGFRDLMNTGFAAASIFGGEANGDGGQGSGFNFSMPNFSGGTFGSSGTNDFSSYHNYLATKKKDALIRGAIPRNI